MSDPRTRTILGFHTRNRASAKGMDITFYGFIIPMEWIFAFFGLAVILYDFEWWMKAIVASAIVGLAVFTKIALYGRKHFTAAALAICMIAATATVFFDFIGLSMHTSVRSMLGDEIAKAESIVTDYNTVMLRHAADEAARLEGERLRRTSEVNTWESEQLVMLDRRQVGTEVVFEKEKRGVREEGFSGLEGVGNRAREREADVVTTEMINRVEADNIKAQAKGRCEFINQEINTKIDAITGLRAKLAELVIPPDFDKKQGELDFSSSQQVTRTSIIDRIIAAGSFEELVGPTRDANNRMSEASALYKAATGTSKDPRKVEVIGGNLFELSFRALFSGDIAAVVSLFLAMVFGWLDPLMAYLIRKTEQDDDFDDEARKTDELPAARRGPVSIP